jgi:HAD superfamily hydrolase (TIGR01509 family)
MAGARVIEAVVFDLDGVILDSERAWDAVREGLAREHGVPWSDREQRAMMGMSAPEWSGYMHETLGIPLEPAEIDREVVRRLSARYEARLPLILGAVEAVRALARRWPLGLASSSNREVIDLALAGAGLAEAFRITVASEEVARGKPAPDVYLEATARLGVPPGRSAAVEDSANGLRAAHAAGMRLVAIPNADFPPPPEALALADVVLSAIAELGPSTIEALQAA